MGKMWKSEAVSYRDPETGVKVTRLVNSEYKERLLYFHNFSWYDNNRRMVFTSYRDGGSLSAMSLDMETFEFEQLTVPESGFTPVTVDEIKNLCYGYLKNPSTGKSDMIAYLNLKTGEITPLYRFPDGQVNSGGITCTPGGRYIYGGYSLDVSDRLPPPEKEHTIAWIGMKERTEINPPSVIFRIDVETTKVEIVLEQNSWIGHVNVNPVDNNKLSFCHEGIWSMVDNRIWGLNLNQSNPKPIMLRPRTEDGEGVGHEWWTRDGNWIGYQSHRKNRECFGYVNFGGEAIEEFDYLFTGCHVQSYGRELMITDCNARTPYERILQRQPDGSVLHKVLCRHGAFWTNTDGHPNSRLSPDEKYGWFISDVSGVPQIYCAEIPEDLSVLPDVKGRL